MGVPAGRSSKPRFRLRAMASVAAAFTAGAIAGPVVTAWAQDGSRTIFAIDRKNRRVLHIEIPPVNAGDARDALPFRTR